MLKYKHEHDQRSSMEEKTAMFYAFVYKFAHYSTDMCDSIDHL